MDTYADMFLLEGQFMFSDAAHIAEHLTPFQTLNFIWNK